jgi:hypothetical protein
MFSGVSGEIGGERGAAPPGGKAAGFENGLEMK